METARIEVLEWLLDNIDEYDMYMSGIIDTDSLYYSMTIVFPTFDTDEILKLMKQTEDDWLNEFEALAKSQNWPPKRSTTMTKFNPDNKDVLTIYEALDPAMYITEPQYAEQYLDDYAAYIQEFLDAEPCDDDKSAADIARENIGYYAGYYDSETMARVNRLFSCSHPIFG